MTASLLMASTSFLSMQTSWWQQVVAMNIIRLFSWVPCQCQWRRRSMITMGIMQRSLPRNLSLSYQMRYVNYTGDWSKLNIHLHWLPPSRAWFLANTVIYLPSIQITYKTSSRWFFVATIQRLLTLGLALSLTVLGWSIHLPRTDSYPPTLYQPQSYSQHWSTWHAWISYYAIL